MIHHHHHYKYNHYHHHHLVELLPAPRVDIADVGQTVEAAQFRHVAVLEEDLGLVVRHRGDVGFAQQGRVVLQPPQLFD